MTSEPAGPAIVRVLAPVEADTSVLIVALSNGLRTRGFRVGTATVRAALGSGDATVLVTGGGARVTLPGALPTEVLRARAASLDPALDLLLIEGARGDGGVGGHDRLGVHTIEVVGAGEAVTSGDLLLGTVTAAQLEHASPADDFGLAAIIEERVFAGMRGGGGLAEAAQAPIESQRRLLDRSGAPPAPRRTTSGRPPVSGWRRWLGL